MIAIGNWLAAVVQLFDHTLQALLGEVYFLMLFEVLVLLMVLGLFSSMLRAGRKV